MAFEQGQKPVMDDGLDEATQELLEHDHDIEEQAIYTKQAKEHRGLFLYETYFKEYQEFDIDGIPWVWLRYGEYGLAHFYKCHASEENLGALQEGDAITILRENEERILRGSVSSKFVVAQISSGRGIVYQSPGFTMPDSVAVPSPRS